MEPIDFIFCGLFGLIGLLILFCVFMAIRAGIYQKKWDRKYALQFLAEERLILITNAAGQKMFVPAHSGPNSSTKIIVEEWTLSQLEAVIDYLEAFPEINELK